MDSAAKKAHLHVLFDSSAIRQLTARNDFRRSLASFVQPCQSGALVVHIPEMVMRECATGLADDAIHGLRAFQDLRRTLGWIKDIRLRREISEAIVRLEGLGGSLQELISAGLHDWMTEIGAVVEPISSADASAIFDLYFDGKPPFKQRKSRNDILDGFIHDTVRRLAKSHGDVSVVVADTMLRNACGALTGVQVYPSFAQFEQSEAFLGICVAATPSNLGAWFPDALEIAKASDFFSVQGIRKPLLAALKGRSLGLEWSDTGFVVESLGTILQLITSWERSRGHGQDSLLVPIEAEVKVRGTVIRPYERGFSAEHPQLRGLDAEVQMTGKVATDGIVNDLAYHIRYEESVVLRGLAIVELTLMTSEGTAVRTVTLDIADLQFVRR